ncbi:MAG: DNA-binding response regulator [Verrucomicrobia bacterium]|nr:MAG: DNA-binding response regulator [Verrucomicrobiota bacterium]
MNPKPIKVAIIEDNDPLREAYVAILNGTEGFRCIGDFRTGEAAIEKIPRLQPEVVLVDIGLPKLSGIDCIRELKGLLNETQFLALTINQDPQTIFQALEAGASGYLLKRQRPAKILEAIEEVHGGGAPMSSAIARLVVQTFHERGHTRREQEGLTKREHEILEHLAKGSRSKEIAEQLRVSVDTVHTHLRHIYEKLHVHSRAAAVAKHLRR